MNVTFYKQDYRPVSRNLKQNFPKNSLIFSAHWSIEQVNTIPDLIWL